MTSVYSNKFTIQISDVARVIFVDERSPFKPGFPMPATTVAEVVMTKANLLALANSLSELKDKLK